MKSKARPAWALPAIDPGGAGGARQMARGCTISGGHLVMSDEHRWRVSRIAGRKAVGRHLVLWQDRRVADRQGGVATGSAGTSAARCAGHMASQAHMKLHNPGYSQPLRQLGLAATCGAPRLPGAWPWPWCGAGRPAAAVRPVLSGRAFFSLYCRLPSIQHRCRRKARAGRTDEGETRP